MPKNAQLTWCYHLKIGQVESPWNSFGLHLLIPPYLIWCWIKCGSTLNLFSRSENLVFCPNPNCWSSCISGSKSCHLYSSWSKHWVPQQISLQIIRQQNVKLKNPNKDSIALNPKHPLPENTYCQARLEQCERDMGLSLRLGLEFPLVKALTGVDICH